MPFAANVGVEGGGAWWVPGDYVYAEESGGVGIPAQGRRRVFDEATGSRPRTASPSRRSSQTSRTPGDDHPSHGHFHRCDGGPAGATLMTAHTTAHQEVLDHDHVPHRQPFDRNTPALPPAYRRGRRRGATSGSTDRDRKSTRLN